MRNTTLTAAVLLLVIASAGIAKENAALSSDMLNRIEARFEKTEHPTNLYNAVTNNSLKALSLNRARVIEHDKFLSLKLTGPGMTNQKSTGRCWLFAGLNVFSPDVMTKLDIKSFEFSQPYLAFWDKMEKANYFLEEIIRLRDRDIYDRELEIVLDGPLGDGGWWHYFTDLVDKYGLVPLSTMPETKQSSATGTINKLAQTKLSRAAADIRRMHGEGKSVDDMRVLKEDVLAEIYTILVYAYGTPPEEFTYRYESKDTTVGLSEPKTYTPGSFYKELFGGKLPKMAVIMNHPGKDYDVLYRMESSRNMADREDLQVLNLPIDALKKYAFKSLTDSQAVWFACDVGPDNYRDSGIMAAGIYDYGATLGMDFSISKTERILYSDSYPNHAMVLTGADTTNDGDPTKWLVENSWGDKGGDKGYWYMYDDWFDEYVYLVVIEEKYLDDADREKLKQDPVVFPMWEPFARALRHLK